MSLHSVTDPKNLDLNPSQEEFLFAWERFLGFFGGVGNGKTTIACLKVIEICRTFPNSRGVVARKTWAALESTTMEEFFSLCPPDLLDPKGTRRSAGSPQAKFKNGSTVLFRHLEVKGRASETFQRLSNLNLNFVLIDQAEEIDSRWFNLFRTRLRRVVRDEEGRVCPHQLMLIGNMAGKNWIWSIFVNEKRENHRMIEASTLENQANLPEEYVNDLLSAPENWKQRYVFGSWDDYEGLIFNEFKRHIHEIPKFVIPASWPKFRSIDHGMVKPTACTWWAVDPDGNCYLYREYYRGGLTIREHVRAILQLSLVDQSYRQTLYDPSVFYKTLQDSERGFYSPYDEYLDQQTLYINENPEYRCVGLWGYPGNNNFTAGVGRVNNYAYEDPKHINPMTGKVGSPRIFIFEGMTNWWNEQGDYTWKDISGVDGDIRTEVVREVEDPTKPNHLMDTTRYFIMSRPRVSDLVQILKEEKKSDGWSEVWKPKRKKSWKVA